MDTLIVYASKHGTTHEIAERISRLIGFNRCRTINIAKEKVPSLENYDTVIIGGSIYFGKIQKKIQRFCEENLQELLTKRIGLFICCMNNEAAKEEFNGAFPADLISHAAATGEFGGTFNFEDMNFIEKFIVRKHIGVDHTIRRINAQSINHFAILMQ
ncbi:MAG: flavodoxin domain-containing protein [Balneolaceae bacterium]|nr:flavodoxin domain-containing protein [Balneolaceae bacterium]